jgi:hypothetical protein
MESVVVIQYIIYMDKFVVHVYYALYNNYGFHIPPLSSSNLSMYIMYCITTTDSIYPLYHLQTCPCILCIIYMDKFVDGKEGIWNP